MKLQDIVTRIEQEIENRGVNMESVESLTAKRDKLNVIIEDKVNYDAETIRLKKELAEFKELLKSK